MGIIAQGTLDLSHTGCLYHLSSSLVEVIVESGNIG